MKNENEYVLDGRHFLRDIRKCECQKCEGEEYLLSCRIPERGEHEYRYRMDSGLLTKERNDKYEWHLEEKAEQRIRDAVARFEEEILRFDENSPVRVPVEEGKCILLYRRVSRHHFDVRTEYLKDGVLLRTGILRGLTVQEMIKAFADACDACGLKGMHGYSYRNGKEDILESPLYQAALRTGDVLLEKQLVMEYKSILSPEDAAWLSAKTEERVLPSLPEEYDRKFFVDADTIPAGAFQGYLILHRPYFRMKDSTHSIFTLNPHTREGVDAAPKNAPSMAFADYLKLFEEAGDGRRSVD